VVLFEGPNIGVGEEWDRVWKVVVCYVVGVGVALVDFVSEGGPDVLK